MMDFTPPSTLPASKTGLADLLLSVVLTEGTFWFQWFVIFYLEVLSWLTIVRSNARVNIWSSFFFFFKYSLKAISEILIAWPPHINLISLKQSLTVLNGEKSGNSVGIPYRLFQRQNVSCQGSHREDRIESFMNPVHQKTEWKKIPRAVTVLQQSPRLWEATSSEPPHSSSATGTPLLWQAWPQASPPGGIHSIPWDAGGQHTEGQGCSMLCTQPHCPQQPDLKLQR